RGALTDLAEVPSDVSQQSAGQDMIEARAGSGGLGLVDDLEDLPAQEGLDDLAAVAVTHHRVLVVTGRAAGGVLVRRRGRGRGGGRGVASAADLSCGRAGGLRRFAGERRPAAVLRRRRGVLLCPVALLRRRRGVLRCRVDRGGGRRGRRRRCRVRRSGARRRRGGGRRGDGRRRGPFRRGVLRVGLRAGGVRVGRRAGGVRVGGPAGRGRVGQRTGGGRVGGGGRRSCGA